MEFLNQLAKSVESNLERNAFYINDTFYTYLDFAQVISGIRHDIKASAPSAEKNIGLIANNDVETYSSIIALLLEGRAYVPINPDVPRERNENIIKQAALSTIIDSSENPIFPQLKTIRSKAVPRTGINLIPQTTSPEDLAYMLFTSGTTGIPKGVPITRKCLAGFIEACDALGIHLNNKDRCLQMFELTFDLSVMSYLLPLLNGACVYTIPKNEIKFSYIFKLMDEQELTISLMVPSILQYLRPYFGEIVCPKMKFSLFCGEALPLDVTKEWSHCVPNAKILNVYGPTENTIFCTSYTFDRLSENKAHNGLLSIGKPMAGTDVIIIDSDERQLPLGETGELCLSGIQLTPGYWKNPRQDADSFFYADYCGHSTRFYKSGDLCYGDKNGDLMYAGRLDSQVKVQGFRVELSEIEFTSKAYLGKINAVAVAFSNRIGNTEIGLVIESHQFETSGLLEYLKLKLPSYMIPTQIYLESTFPLNINGKTDRNWLKNKFFTLKPVNE